MSNTTNKPSTTIPINLCEPGDVLSNDVHNQKGQKVVSSDTELTENLIKRLVGSGVKRVNVYGTKGSDQTEVEETPDKKETSGPATLEKDGRLIINDDLEDDFIGENDLTLKGDLTSGATLTSRGDIRLLGDVKDGTVRSMDGEIVIEGDIQSDQKEVQLISNHPIQVQTVVDSQLSVRGSLIVNGAVNNSRINCLGNLVVHDEKQDASITNSELEVEGRFLGDQVLGNDENSCEFEFRDPDIVQINRKRNKKKSKIDELKQEAEKLHNLIKTVSELGEQVKTLPEEKKKKIKDRTEKYNSIKQRIDENHSDLDTLSDRLDEIRTDRRFFMRVLGDLHADTTIDFENSSLTVSDDEHDVHLYKKSMIVIQDASDLPFEVDKWIES